MSSSTQGTRHKLDGFIALTRFDFNVIFVLLAL